MRKAVAAFSFLAILSALIVGFSIARSTAAGGPKSFHAVLMTGSQEFVEAQDPNVAPPTGAGSGVAHLVLHPDGMICVNMTVQGLSSTIINQHIHGPAPAGVRTPGLYPLPLETDGVWRDACVGPLKKAEIEHLNKGKLYLNVHTTDFPNGEVRGQIFK